MAEICHWDVSNNGWQPCMSSFSYHPVTFRSPLPGVEQIKARRAEHGFHACKPDPEAPGYLETVEAILAAPEPRDAKRLGNDRQFTVLRHGWDEGGSLAVMRAIVAAKTDQHADVRQALEASGNKVLVEVTTWGDQIWGTDEKGVGRNQLGCIWMAERNRRWPRDCSSAWSYENVELLRRLKSHLLDEMTKRGIDWHDLGELLFNEPAMTALKMNPSTLDPLAMVDSYLYWMVAAFSVLDLRIEPALVDRLL